MYVCVCGGSVTAGPDQSQPSTVFFICSTRSVLFMQKTFFPPKSEKDSNGEKVKWCFHKIINGVGPSVNNRSLVFLCRSEGVLQSSFDPMLRQNKIRINTKYWLKPHQKPTQTFVTHLSSQKEVLETQILEKRNKKCRNTVWLHWKNRNWHRTKSIN